MVEEGTDGLLQSEDVTAPVTSELCLEQRRQLPCLIVLAVSAVLFVWPAAGVTSATIGSTILAAELKGKQECAAAKVENCSDVRCCRDVGHQCYEKAPGWAVCMMSCDQNKMRQLDAAHEKWSCKPLGERRRCANSTEDCRNFGCCASPGMQCYEKDANSGMCLESCDSKAMLKHDPNGESWKCTPVGERNFVSKCSWAGEDCSATKCCNNDGFVCALKDKSSAACTQRIKTDRWTSQSIPIPPDWNGKVLGRGRSEFEVEQVPEGEPIAGTSLFCLMVYLPNSTEETLMKLAEKNRASIFGCEDAMTVHAWKSSGDWDLAMSTIINTDVFFNAWRRVLEDGRYLEHDWTVKADPDCVFFADRLRSHLVALRAPPNLPIYLKNNDMDPGLGNKGFLGAIEVFSTMAVQTYFANSEGCERTLGTNCGEDAFFKACMDALGVGFMIDPSILTPDYNPKICNKAERVAFHPIKAATEWQCCVDVVMGVPREVAYGKCKPSENVERKWQTQS